MCGIAGFTQYNINVDQNENKAILEKMGEAIFHRGPDAGGVYVDEKIGLCHRRLSIIDLSEAGNQPMHSTCGNYVIVFNGEIYNFPEIRAQLVEEGYQFQNHTDTEVLLALYSKYGEGMMPHINGMFAFALWDKTASTLFIARDRLGKKPLYYWPDANNIHFASELKSLMVLDGFPREIRKDALYDFFAHQYVPDPKTIFEGVHKLPPAHCMTINSDGFEIKQYWDVTFSNLEDKTNEQWQKELDELLDACTKRRMLSDVPLGAFLSGGVDSSAVVALMAKNSETPVKTCSIGFDDEKFNETEFAQLVADEYKTEHHEFTVHDNVADNLAHIVSFFDEPFADPSLVPTFFVSKLARQEVTVAVAGDGGDEVFAGYEKYSIDHIENKVRGYVPSVLRKSLCGPLSTLCSKLPGNLFKKASSLLYSISLDPAMGFYVSNSQIRDHQWEQLASPELKNALGDYHPSNITLSAYNKADGEDHVAKLLYTDIKTYLPGDILVKVDRMSMANSLEVRAPILDYKVLEFAGRMPTKYKFVDGDKKVILRKTCKKYLPDSVLDRKKMGFSVPLDSWFRTELKTIAEERLLKSKQGLREYFVGTEIDKLWQEHQSQKRNHGTLLWSMLMFQMWWERYIP